MGRQKKVVVIGDCGLDIDILVEPEGNVLSRELDIPFQSFSSLTFNPGGAGNIAVCLKALGIDVTLITLLGTDHFGNILKHELARLQIPVISIPQPRQLCFIKLYDSRTLKHFRRYDIKPVPVVSVPPFIDSSFNDSFDAVIIADYCEYCEGTVKPLTIKAARTLTLPTFGTSRNNPALLNGLDYIFATGEEFEESCSSTSWAAELPRAGESTPRGNLGTIITNGENGCVADLMDLGIIEVPAFKVEPPLFTCGCGDAFISAFVDYYLRQDVLLRDEFNDALIYASAAAAVVAKQLVGTGTATHEQIDKLLYDNQLGVLK